MTRKIEAFVVGAQKCGTTALHHFLSQHPSIQMGVRKELHLFDNEKIDWTDQSIEGIVDGCYSTEDGLRMDVTPIYMYWPRSMERIAQYNPDAKIIVMLRDPIERAYSHWKMEHGRNMDGMDFSTAIRSGRNRFDKKHRVFSYVERGLYAEQLERIYRHFPNTQVLVLSQQDLLNHHVETLNRICDFLSCGRFPTMPQSKVVFSSGTEDSISLEDRRYLELMYRESNQHLFDLCGVDFRSVAQDSQETTPSFWIPRDFPDVHGIRSIEHEVETTNRRHDAIWFHRLVLENLMTPYMARIHKVLQRKQLANNYLNTYGQLARSFVMQFQVWLDQSHAEYSHLPKIIMFPTDMEYPYDVPDSVICLRTSMVRYKRRPLDIAMPLPQLEWILPCEPTTNIGVGFCGVPNHVSRQRLLRALQRQQSIPTQFIFRDRFWGRIREQSTPAQLQILRQEYEDNMTDNVFVVCSRGAGNYSIRFYETLRAGRIPIMLDTDMVFPLEEIIDYSEFIICEATPELVIQRMQDWIEHRDLTSIQRRCREIWEKYLYFPRYLEHLPSVLSKLIDVG